MRKGTSLIDLVISIAILAALFGGIFLVYFSILSSVASVNLRSAASSAIANEIETIRNLPYDSVGTVGGVPAGVIPEFQTIPFGSYSFLMQTVVRNIDDPFDGTLGGNPNDTAPADYKLVSIEATCPMCDSAFDETITTTVAPKGLESASTQGSLSLLVINAAGVGVSNATIHVSNASVTPSIDLVDTTNASGVLLLVGVPTSTQRYAITVTKPGYSSDQTYLPGASGNPSPTEPHLTAAAQTVTQATFKIDQVSQLIVNTTNNRCVPIGNESFSMTGSKMIGSNPVIYKFSTSSATNASGTITLPNIEWDSYSFLSTDASKNVVGTIPLSPMSVNPNTMATFQFVLQSAANPSLLVTAIDAATGAGIANATATLSGAGNATLLTGHATLSQSDWSGGQYASKTGVDTSVAGQISLSVDGSGAYPTSTTASLISNTFDLGGSSSSLYSLSWAGSDPPQTGPNSLEFQVAANNDNATWNFVGLDGTAATYFTSPGLLPASLSNNRYLRYEVFMSTADSTVTPRVNSVSFDFGGNCVPPAQSLFTSLAQGSYTLDMIASGYAENSTTISIGPGFQSSTLPLQPL